MTGSLTTTGGGVVGIIVADVLVVLVEVGVDGGVRGARGGVVVVLVEVGVEGGVRGARGARGGVFVVLVVLPPCSNLFTVLRGGSLQSHCSQTMVEHCASLSQAEPIGSCSEQRCEGRHC